MIPILDRLPVMRRNSYQALLYLPPMEIKFLVESRFGKCFFSNDEDSLPKKTAKASINRIYEYIGMKPDQRFTSFVLCNEEFSSNACEVFGSIVLVLKKKRIAQDSYFFNGDVKNLAYRLVGGFPISKVVKPRKLTAPAGQILALARECVRKTRSYPSSPDDERPFPYRVGLYFEIRMFRAVVPEDIKQIVVPKGLADRELKLIEKLAWHGK
ncbi:MAG: hypothetical protein GX442_21700 [Candidatus Riflebacteria bacterium]|nr:hypothetical protein [Candidatus Riflebacteria bacterium]